MHSLQSEGDCLFSLYSACVQVGRQVDSACRTPGRKSDRRDRHPRARSPPSADQFYTHQQDADGCLSVRRNTLQCEISEEKSDISEMLLLEIQIWNCNNRSYLSLGY
ncbi:hypothetical protein ILYODFUR_013627 [Ilyodon furcidens]|uniref:Uncharacterized protein n=1 Tax=Ilyodon furcidens TaxID=33524 RepID=A0ABV0TBK6_9TELE